MTIKRNNFFSFVKIILAKFMSKIFLTVLMLTLGFAIAYSQSNNNLKIKQSPEVKELVEKHKKVNEANYEFDGWRVQIFSAGGTNSKDKANLAKAEFLSKYPDTKVYLVFNAPYFKVRLGNFRTKIEALHFIEEIKKDYPFAFAVIDKIEPPEI